MNEIKYYIKSLENKGYCINDEPSPILNNCILTKGNMLVSLYVWSNTKIKLYLYIEFIFNCKLGDELKLDLKSEVRNLKINEVLNT